MILINIIGMGMLGHLAADFFSQFDRLPSKPLKCNQCMSFWLAIGPMILEYGFMGIPVAATSALASELIYKLLTRI